MNALAKPAELKPGIYEGLSMEEYLAMPAASASLMCTLLEQCPRAAWYDSWLNPRRPERTSTAAQSVGTLAHALLLEGSVSKLEVVDPRDYPAKTTGNIPDGWTNQAIRARRDAVIMAGKIPVFPEVAAAIEGMVAEACLYLASVAPTEPAVHDLFQPGGGKSEVTIVWEEDGFLFRMRPDRLANALNLMGDVKTTKTLAEPDRWGRTQLFGMGYYVAAAFYRRGLKAATGKSADYVYLAQEQDAPFLCSLIGLDPMVKQLGDRKIERAMRTWKNCLKTGVWPGYPDRVAYPEAPVWEIAREEAAPPHGNPYDYEKMGWRKRDPSDAELDAAFDALPDR